MLDHRLQEDGSLVNHVGCKCKQVLISCVTSNDCVSNLGAAVLLDFKSFCWSDVVAVAQLQIQLELNLCPLYLKSGLQEFRKYRKLSESTSSLALYLHFVL